MVAIATAMAHTAESEDEVKSLLAVDAARRRWEIDESNLFELGRQPPT